MKSIEVYFAMVLFIMLYKVVLTFESVDETQKCDYSNEIFTAVLFCGVVCFKIFCKMRYRIFVFRYLNVCEISLLPRVTGFTIATAKFRYQKLPSICSSVSLSCKKGKKKNRTDSGQCK